MTDSERSAAEKLGRLAEALADNAMRVSDDEIHAEMREEHGSVEAAADRVRGVISVAIARSGRRKFEAARAEMKKARKASDATVLPLSIVDKRRIVERYAANDGPLGRKLTLAARNGQEMSEAELDSFIEDLRDIGAIDEQGDPA